MLLVLLTALCRRKIRNAGSLSCLSSNGGGVLLWFHTGRRAAWDSLRFCFLAPKRLLGEVRSFRQVLTFGSQSRPVGGSRPRVRVVRVLSASPRARRASKERSDGDALARLGAPRSAAERSAATLQDPPPCSVFSALPGTTSPLFSSHPLWMARAKTCLGGCWGSLTRCATVLSYFLASLQVPLTPVQDRRHLTISRSASVFKLCCQDMWGPGAEVGRGNAGPSGDPRAPPALRSYAALR